MMKLRIEDNFEDVLEKAMDGLGYDAEKLASISGVTGGTVESLLAGEPDEAALRKVAPSLDLDAGALVSLARQAWYPAPVSLPGLACFNSPHPVPGYEAMTVNSYLIWNPEGREALLFDTGAEAEALLKCVQDRALAVKALFLTHTHGDHVKAFDRVCQALGPLDVYAPENEPFKAAHPVKDGARMEIGPFSLEARQTDGHSPGGTTYVVDGLADKVAVVGDSLFCLSMGGASAAYARALENNRERILSLPEGTVLCPGHGPMTTVGEERRHNPFFPEYKQANPELS